MNSRIEYAFIPAAGFGSRLMPLTKITPKCMTQIEKKPVISYVIDRLERVKQIKKIYINTHYLADKVSSFLDNHNLANKIEIIHEKRILGTGGSIKNICFKSNYKETNLLIHNADAFFYGEEFMKDFLNAYNEQEFFLAIVPKKVLPFDESGDFNINAKGQLVFAKGGEYVYTGLSILKTRHFVHWKENSFSLIDVIKMYKSLVGYYIIPNKSKWIDIGTSQKLEYIQKIFN